MDIYMRADELARRDRWLIPMLAAGGFLMGAALFGAGMAVATLLPARCPAPAAGIALPR